MIARAADGTRLNYVVTGNGAPLVLVGGKTSTIAGAWWRFLPIFSQRFRTIAFDNRGAGASDKPDTPYTTELLAEDAVSVLVATGEESAHWFGLSLGGMVLQELALRHPKRTRSLILGATHCGGAQAAPGATPDELAALKESPWRRLAHLYTTAFLLEHADHVAEDAARFGKMPLYAIHRQEQAARGHNACDRLSAIGCPVLILHGRQDRVVPVERAEQLHRAIPGSQLQILDPAGHQFHSEHVDTVAQLVIEFVQRVESHER